VGKNLGRGAVGRRKRLPHFLHCFLVALILACALLGETRPHYGGTLRVELRDAVQSADPPQVGPGIPDLFAGFNITRWEAGHRAVFAADDNAATGRPFLDTVEIEMGRTAREQTADINLGRADIIQIGPGEAPRLQGGRRIWSSSPVRVVALVFDPRMDDMRAREALALAIDRDAIHRVLLQRQGEISGALLPQWLSGYAFLFAAAADLDRARRLAPSGRTMSLAVEDPTLRSIADRIVLNGRDAGLTLSVVPAGGAADIRLVQARIGSSDPARALAGVAAALGLPEPPRADTPEALYNAERGLLEGYRVIPLFHLPDVYLVSPRVKGSPAISPLGEWRFETLWVEGGRP
jgi:peptide/nickel transport system substrate-binding protein